MNKVIDIDALMAETWLIKAQRRQIVLTAAHLRALEHFQERLCQVQ